MVNAIHAVPDRSVTPAPTRRRNGEISDGSAERAWEIAAAVTDPEIPVISIADLGILRDVRMDGGTVTVTITPTYSCCPAMDAIRADVDHALRAEGFTDVVITTVLAPAWTTDWITAEGKESLERNGIAPPSGLSAVGAVPVALSVRCPQCGSLDTEELSRFGSTACKALWRCRTCAEPFDRFKDL